MFAQLISTLITFLTFAILGRVIMDWLVSFQIMQFNNPLRSILIQITEPVLAPIRRYARIGMIDLSPMVAIFILVIIRNAV